jgi:hypothetical protein
MVQAVALRNTSETEIWLRAYKGDFAAQVHTPSSSNL